MICIMMYNTILIKKKNCKTKFHLSQSHMGGGGGAFRRQNVKMRGGHTLNFIFVEPFPFLKGLILDMKLQKRASISILIIKQH